MMVISIIICTYNRAESLGKTLDSLLAQTGCDGMNYEVIVVDNNSTDHTKNTVESFGDKFSGRLKYVFEKQQGLSWARNKGIKEAIGEIIAFTDDDVTVSHNWLCMIIQTFTNSNISCAGGRIYPVWEDALPWWLSEKLYGQLALLDNGEKRQVLSLENGLDIYGANFVVRRSMFDKYGNFCTNLGRKGNIAAGGEETDYTNRLLSAGEVVVYEPLLMVQHRIPSGRLKKEYFIRLQVDMGESSAYQEEFEVVKRKLFGIPIFRIKRFITYLLKYLWVLVKRDEKEGFYYKCKIIKDSVFFMTKIKMSLFT